MDFERLLGTLSDAGVEYILVGGFAGTLHGSARVTFDLDVVYARDAGNIARLAAALAPLEPYLRGAPPGLPFRWDVETIGRGLNFTLTTTLGPLDVFGEISGGGTHESLSEDAETLLLFGREVRVLSLARLIAAKRAAGRPKDLEVIAELEALLDEPGEA